MAGKETSIKILYLWIVFFGIRVDDIVVPLVVWFINPPIRMYFQVIKKTFMPAQTCA